jgi:hypothetical protein
MTDLPAAVRPVLRRLKRRLALGLFLEIWPRWAMASFLMAGTAAVVCRMFFAQAAGFLPFLWIAPILASLPAMYLCIRRAYRPSEIVALADWLSGGHGTLLTLLEKQDPAWNNAPALATLSQVSLPRLKPWRKLGPVMAAALFLSIALFVPQRVLTGPRSTVLANDVVADLKTAAELLKKENLLTPDEQKKLDEEIERIRKDALDRMDASSWEAADALREKVASQLNEKHDAMKWAQESLARYADASQSGAPPNEAQADELAKAIEKLAKTGMLSDAPSDAQQLLGGGEAVAGGRIRLPSDPKQLRKLAAMLAKHLGERNARFSELAKLAREGGRFDPTEFGEFNYEEGDDQDGEPGRGGLGKGRGDADLTWGDESLPFDKFKSTPLPQGSVRSPDDWAPVAVLPGAPKESPELSGPSTGRQFAGTSGQAAWRRTLSPRHYSAVKKYFDNSGTR